MCVFSLRKWRNTWLTDIGRDTEDVQLILSRIKSATSLRSGWAAWPMNGRICTAGPGEFKIQLHPLGRE